MGFDLFVATKRRPADLAPRWQEALIAQGLVVEISPSFSLTSWRGGFLPFRLESAPPSLLGMDLARPVVSGFELYVDRREVNLRTAYPSDAVEIVMQCLGAATLAVLTDGRYEDPQRGTEYKGPDAVEAAREEISRFIASAEPSAFVEHPFPGWAALGVAT